MTPLYVGFFTIGTPYQNEVVECLETLDSFGLEHEFVGVENTGSWVKNCAKKPKVIQRLQRKHDGRPLVYLDVDARVRRQPVLFDTLRDIDIACHYRHGEELLSGTLYFGTSSTARDLVSAWCRLCEASPDVWDQRHLQTVVNVWDQGRVFRLPSEYTRVFDDPKMGDPVIEHLQKSRRYAGTVSSRS